MPDLRYPDLIERDAAGIPLHAAPWPPVARHSHRKAELVHLLSGNLTVQTADGIWVIPPGRALWIPPDTAHSALQSGEVVLQCLFLEPELAARFLPRCHLVSVHPLLRELLLRLSDQGRSDDADATRERNLVTVLLDELALAPTEPFHLPLPVDRRLRQIAADLLERPSLRASTDEWSARIGASPRTLSRLFQRDVGMSLGRWRQLLHVQIALRDLARGTPVGAIAYDLGYETPSAFIDMFKRNTGQTPGAMTKGDRP